MVRKLATRFDFDVDEARRHLFRKFATLTLGDMAENGVRWKSQVQLRHMGIQWR